jgi:hypothetical protein
MTQYRFTDDEYNDAIREAKDAGERLKKNEEVESRLPLDQALRIFEPLSCRIENEPSYPFQPPSPSGNGNNNSYDDNNNDAPLDLADELIRKYHFATVNTSKEIYYFDSKKGVYLSNGDGGLSSITVLDRP